jgi:hypothetical protein
VEGLLFSLQPTETQAIRTGMKRKTKKWNIFVLVLIGPFLITRRKDCGCVVVKGELNRTRMVDPVGIGEVDG